jgi:hypothetical protein
MGGSLGGLMPKIFPGPTTIGSTPNVNPLISAAPSVSAAPTPNQIQNQVPQPVQPQAPLAPPNPVQNPIQNPRRPIINGNRSFYGM